jgi:H+-transporting ATPase
VNLLLFFCIAIIAVDFAIPTLCLVILVILNDGTIMTIARDKVVPSKKPEQWRLGIIAGLAIVIGVCATIALFLMYFFYKDVSSNNKNFFGYPLIILTFLSLLTG